MTSKCVICFEDHDNMWDDGPNMYCQSCVPIREAARGVTSHILDNLYLSDMNAAHDFDGYRMCVHENGPTYTGQCYLIPILVTRPNSKWDRTGAVASTKVLNQAADTIDLHVLYNEPLLVHCVGGIERSPLTLVWWLVRSHRFDTFYDAYDFLKLKRPVVSERLFWLP